jgi:hypothetical protein
MLSVADGIDGAVGVWLQGEAVCNFETCSCRERGPPSQGSLWGSAVGGSMEGSTPQHTTAAAGGQIAVLFSWLS